MYDKLKYKQRRVTILLDCNRYWEFRSNFHRKKKKLFMYWKYIIHCKINVGFFCIYGCDSNWNMNIILRTQCPAQHNGLTIYSVKVNPMGVEEAIIFCWLVWLYIQWEHLFGRKHFFRASHKLYRFYPWCTWRLKIALQLLPENIYLPCKYYLLINM